MIKTLPERPDLGQLKKQAKDLLNDIRAGQPAALARVPQEELASFALADAQRIIAREYGFTSWPKLKLHIETRDPVSRGKALVQAALRGQKEIVDEILRENPRYSRGSIHIVTALGDPVGLRDWLQHDPALAKTRTEAGGWTPLLFTCVGRVGGGDAERAECVRLLLAAGADANEYWIDEAFPDAKLPALYGATGVNNYPRTARVLLEAGANPNDDESVYHAAEHAHFESLEVLKEFGADVSHSAVKFQGNTPLYFLFAVVGGGVKREAGARWLLENGANPNVVCRDVKETALHAAVRRGYSTAIIELMLKYGADPALRRADGRTSLDLAVRGGHGELVAALLKHGMPDDVSTLDRFIGACLRADAAQARALLAANPGLMAQLSPDDRQMVTEAAREGRGDAITLMKQLGFDTNLVDEQGVTPLHAAAWNGRVAAVRALIAAGAEINREENRFKGTPLSWVQHGSLFNRDPAGDYPACAAALLEAGALLPEEIYGAPEVVAVVNGYGKR
ncbi:MAG TPA: ankyrin repeat domain-containing protein [Candidatus Didemnitutus sp.]|nr:ankyrin repeat domain-containing protein [Candidatus Didemnitutus sp.]